MKHINMYGFLSGLPFNGDERELSPEQMRLTKLKEQVPPPPQDLFIEFTKPIYNQITTKIRDFYKAY